MFDLSSFTRKEESRSIDFEWVVKTEGNVTTLAVLSISHNKAGYNMFSGVRSAEDTFKVSLTNQSEERSNGFTSRGYFLFSGLGITALPAGNRFSKKKLQEAAEQGFARFTELVEAEDPQVMRYLNAETAGVRA